MQKSCLSVLAMLGLFGCGLPAEAPGSDEPTASAADPAVLDEVPGTRYFNPGPIVPPVPSPDPDPPPPPPGDDGDPNITLSEQGIYFGQVCPGAQAQRTLTVGNSGNGTLSITALNVTGEGFSLVDRPALPVRIRPGRTLGLVLSFGVAAGNLLPFDGNLRISSNDPDEPNVNVLLSALSLPATAAASPRQINFGRLDPGGTRTRTVTLSNSGRCPCHIVGSRLSGTLSRNVSVGSLPVRVDPGETESVSIRLSCFGEDSEVDVVVRLLDRGGRSVASIHVTGFCND